ncbi:formyltransferase family protein [Halomicrobium sp. LC1Hm]|uniref:formyltransferase family protein n=1 Tax=Halomicrobium sp. LC1Hm TaxID=2610902 RepID=UPI0012984793|nr:formyltransferase family protein [Halomicrobium sp. LC1Hm]QGA81904.1 Methionyl-tRNA formyltransferase [Halomicrobium sp. LC1Hm]
MTLRIVVVTQDDPFYVPHFFDKFFEAIPADVEIERVVLLEPFNESFPALVRRMYRLYGLTNFVRRGVSYVGRTVADAIGMGKYSVESVAANHNIPVTERESINTDAFVESITEVNVDVILSVSAPEIFDEAVLNAPVWGCLNVHTSELPKYRGMLPTFWALYHGENEVGVTVHTMVEDIDQGKIVRQRTFSIDGMALDEIIIQGKRTGGKLAADALKDISNGTEDLRLMEGESSYFSFPTAEHRRELQRQGGKLL